LIWAKFGFDPCFFPEYNYSIIRNTNSARWNVNYLQKAFKVISSIARMENGEGTVQAVSEETGFPMSTTHRILNELIECNVLVKQEDVKRYRLCLAVIPLVQEILKKTHVDSLRTIMTELRDTTNETVFLSELTHEGIASVLTVESKRVFSFRAHPGVYLPVHCTAAGLSIAAFNDFGLVAKLVARAMSQSDPYAGHCSSENLQKRLETIREEGYAFCDNEYEPGLQALAVPVFNEDKEVKASITAIAPGARFSNNPTRVRIVEALKKSANAIKKLI